MQNLVALGLMVSDKKIFKDLEKKKKKGFVAMKESNYFKKF